MRTADRLLARLRSRDGVVARSQQADLLLSALDRHEEITLERTRAGREQLAAGAWSWIVLGPSGMPEAGSAQPMSEVLRSECIEITTGSRTPGCQIHGVSGS